VSEQPRLCPYLWSTQCLLLLGIMRLIRDMSDSGVVTEPACAAGDAGLNSHFMLPQRARYTRSATSRVDDPLLMRQLPRKHRTAQRCWRDWGGNACIKLVREELVLRWVSITRSALWRSKGWASLRFHDVPALWCDHGRVIPREAISNPSTL
jgi:hypothetical protein